MEDGTEGEGKRERAKMAKQIVQQIIDKKTVGLSRARCMCLFGLGMDFLVWGLY